MSSSAWLACALVAFCLACLAATGRRVLRTFSRSELEGYCRWRKNEDRFTQIAARHDDVAISVECLQVFTASIAIFCLLLGWLPAELADLRTPSASMLGKALAAGLILLAATSWIPYVVAELWSAPFVYHTWTLWVGLNVLAAPLKLGLWLFESVLRRLAGQPMRAEADEEELFEDEIRSIVSAGLRDGFLEEDAGDMIESVIELGDADVADVMTQRSQVDAFEVNLPWPEVVAYVIQVGRTRIPVFEGSFDKVLGVLYVKDLMPEMARPQTERRSLRQLLRRPHFVPKTMRLDELLREFLKTRNHLAIVVDEYGAVEGVITIEDVLEEIVGEIIDESDEDEDAEVVQFDAYAAEASGRTHVADLNELFGLSLHEGDDYDSVGGLVISHLGRIPAPGESVQVEGVCLTVLAATTRRVDRVKLEWGPRPQNDSASA